MDRQENSIHNGGQGTATRRVVFAALMAALVFAGSWARITMPINIAGNTAFHLGNITCALSGILLGPGWGAAAQRPGWKLRRRL